MINCGRINFVTYFYYRVKVFLIHFIHSQKNLNKTKTYFHTLSLILIRYLKLLIIDFKVHTIIKLIWLCLKTVHKIFYKIKSAVTAVILQYEE